MHRITYEHLDDKGATKHPVVALLSSRRWVAQPLLKEMEDAVRQQERIDNAAETPGHG